jgi:hypothetical protein
MTSLGSRDERAAGAPAPWRLHGASPALRSTRAGPPSKGTGKAARDVPGSERGPPEARPQADFDESGRALGMLSSCS